VRPRAGAAVHRHTGRTDRDAERNARAPDGDWVTDRGLRDQHRHEHKRRDRERN